MFAGGVEPSLIRAGCLAQAVPVGAGGPPPIWGRGGDARLAVLQTERVHAVPFALPPVVGKDVGGVRGHTNRAMCTCHNGCRGLDTLARGPDSERT